MILKTVSVIKRLFWLEAYHIKVKRTGSRGLSLLYIGNKDLLRYYLSIFFSDGDNFEINLKEKIFAGNISSYFEKNKESKDLLLLRLNPLFKFLALSEDSVRIPEYIRQKLCLRNNDKKPVFLVKACKRNMDYIIEGLNVIFNSNTNKSEPLSNYRNMGIKEEIRIVRKKKFTIRLTKDLKLLEYFYNNMYISHIYKRFSFYRSIESLKTIKTLFKNGFLLLIGYGTQCLFGAVSYIKGDTLFLKYSGIDTRNAELKNRCTSDALFFYTIIIAEKMGLSCVDFGVSRPLLNDGLVRFKKKWGGEIYKAIDCKNYLIVKFTNLDFFVQDFFREKCFIFQDGCALKTFRVNNPLVIDEIK